MTAWGCVSAAETELLTDGRLPARRAAVGQPGPIDFSSEDLPQDPAQLLRVLDAVDGGDLEAPLVAVRPRDEVPRQAARLQRFET